MPWLPLGEENMTKAVDRQDGDPASLLNLTRELLALRSKVPALRNGTCEVILADEARLVLRRRSGAEAVLAAFNLSAGEAAWPEGLPTSGTPIFAVNGAEPGRLPALAAVLIRESK
jgi:alpha-glucosidase